MSEEMSVAQWYVVHTYSGYENKVKTNIEKTIENRNLQDQILEVSVPVEEVIEITKTGKKKQVQRKIFPGYVLIHMFMNDDTWYVVRNTRGVTGFVGPGSKPVPLTEQEMKNLGIDKTTEDNAAEKNVQRFISDYAIGDMVVAISDTWKDTEGVIKSINESKQTVTIMVNILGRETPVELGFTDIRHM